MNKEKRALDLLFTFANRYFVQMKYEYLFGISDQHELFDKYKYDNIGKVYEAMQILQKLIDEKESK